MSNDDAVLSRRRCLQQLSVAGVAASLGSSLTGEPAGAAQRPASYINK